MIISRFFSLSLRSLLSTLALAILLIAASKATKAATINVPSGGSFQAALNAAQPGDEIVLEAGATYIGPFTLPVKSGSSYITIRSSAMSALPSAGVRVSPSNASAMPKIVSPGVAESALYTAPGAHHFRFIGIEFKPINAQAFIYDLISLGKGLEQTSLDQVPHHIIIDRCYIHAEPTQSLKRGVALNSAYTEIINSYISDFKSTYQDSQAICGWNGPGPFKIINNYLEGSGENVMFGGAAPSIQNLVPSDIEFRRNHIAKPSSWRNVWIVKNLFELKNARRVIIDGNLFERNWAHAQQGFAILFTVRNDEEIAPWSTVEDVQFTNNILRHTGSAINILGRDYIYPSQQASRITIKNNFIEDVNHTTWGGNGVFLQATEANGVVVDHNTVLHQGNIINGYGVPTTGFVFTNNLMNHNDYGIFGDSVGLGNSALNAYFPNAVVLKNLIAATPTSLYPTNNFYPANLSDAQFVNQNTGDYRLAATSPYRNAGTDGKDVGCNFNELFAAMNGTNQTQTFPVLIAAARDRAILLAQTENPSREEIQTLINRIEEARVVLQQRAGFSKTDTLIDEALQNAILMAQRALHVPNHIARKYLAKAAQYLDEATVMSQTMSVSSSLETSSDEKNY
jgi:hypothetical protein